MKSSQCVVTLLATLLIRCSGSKENQPAVPSITPAEAVKFLDGDTTVVFLDVRSGTEYASETGHVRGAVLVPVDSLRERVAELEPRKSKTFIVYCKAGGRSARAQKILAELGFRALNMLGGITRWNNEHLPVVKE